MSGSSTHFSKGYRLDWTYKQAVYKSLESARCCVVRGQPRYSPLAVYSHMPSLFPPPLSPVLLEFSSLLITGAYHPSAPIHLALSSPRAIICAASRSALVSNLHQFNDAFLTEESGKGSTSGLTSKIEILYCSRVSDVQEPWFMVSCCQLSSKPCSSVSTLFPFSRGKTRRSGYRTYSSPSENNSTNITKHDHTCWAIEIFLEWRWKQQLDFSVRTLDGTWTVLFLIPDCHKETFCCPLILTLSIVFSSPSLSWKTCLRQ